VDETSFYLPIMTERGSGPFLCICLTWCSN
jgi:hypothetical protein